MTSTSFNSRPPKRSIAQRIRIVLLFLAALFVFSLLRSKTFDSSTTLALFELVHNQDARQVTAYQRTNAAETVQRRTKRSSAAAITSNTTSRNKIAVVWTTTGVTTECEYLRIKHLVETAGNSVDTWVMPANYLFKQQKNETTDLERAKAFMAKLPNVRVFPQLKKSKHFQKFNGNSGSAKLSFLKFMVQHPEYDFAWHIENDVFFTGHWKDLFEPEDQRDNKTDFLSSRILDQSTGEWHHLKRCRIFNVHCAKLAMKQIGWMLTRVSKPLAISLLKDIRYGLILGHHEAIVAPYSARKNFTYGTIDKSKVGLIRSGSPGNRTDHRKALAKFQGISSFDPSPGTLIHPVKCSHYENKSIETDIQEWL